MTSVLWHELEGIGAASGFLIAMLVIAHRLRGLGLLGPEASRKMMHIALGGAAISFPWLFDTVWPALVVAGLTVTVLILMRAGALGTTASTVVHGVGRRSEGDLYFPIAAALLFAIARGSTLAYVLPIATLTFADPAAALAGRKLGRTRYPSVEWSSAKSVEGSGAFLVVASCVAVLAMTIGTTLPMSTLTLIAVIFAIVTTLLEASAWRGLDNLFIPFGGSLLLRWLIALDDRALVTLLAVTVAMVAVVLSFPSRRQASRGAMERLRSMRA